MNDTTFSRIFLIFVLFSLSLSKPGFCQFTADVQVHTEQQQISSGDYLQIPDAEKEYLSSTNLSRENEAGDFDFLYATWISRKFRIRPDKPKSFRDSEFRIVIQENLVKVQARDGKRLYALQKEPVREGLQVSFQLPIRQIIPGKHKGQGMLVVGPFTNDGTNSGRHLEKYSVIVFQGLDEGQIWISLGKFFETAKEAAAANMDEQFRKGEQGFYVSEQFLAKQKTWKKRFFTEEDAKSFLLNSYYDLDKEGTTILGLPEWITEPERDEVIGSMHILKSFVQDKVQPFASLDALIDAHLHQYYQEEETDLDIPEKEEEDATYPYLLLRLTQRYMKEKAAWFEDEKIMQGKQTPKASELSALQQKQQDRNAYFSFYEDLNKLFRIKMEFAQDADSYLDNILNDLNDAKKAAQNATSPEEKKEHEEREKQFQGELCQEIDQDFANIAVLEKRLENDLKQFQVPEAFIQRKFPDIAPRIQQLIEEIKTIDQDIDSLRARRNTLQEKYCQ